MQTEIEEYNSQLETGLMIKRAMVEEFKIDLYNYFLDGSDQFDF